MIVMKFGGTSVESQEAIERVTGIVKSNRSAAAHRGRVRHGQDHEQAAEPPRQKPPAAGAIRRSRLWMSCGLII